MILSRLTYHEEQASHGVEIELIRLAAESAIRARQRVRERRTRLTAGSNRAFAVDGLTAVVSPWPQPHEEGKKIREFNRRHW